MIDFLMVSTRSSKRGVVEIYPKFLIKRSSDLMIRGGDFYAIWLEERGLWSTDEQDALQLIDRELDAFAKEYKKNSESEVRVLHMWDAESGMIDSWHKYCQKQLRDSFHMLDEKLIFANTPTNKDDYASKRLSYPLEKGDLSAYEKLISTLYSEEERHKLEWAIGSIVSGDSKHIQKFMVLYGAAGTGKSTILNIVQQLFDGYYSVFDAKSLGSSNNSFALEAFKTNPLVAIQHDGDLSKIEDNTRLNSLVSHELMTVNEKFKSTYSNRFKCFLFMGTNKPVKITDAKSGLIRRLIDVSPSGNKLGQREYGSIVKKVSFELGAIAEHCLSVYNEDPGAYDDYIPISMLGASNDFYNFIIDSYHIFSKEDSTTLKASWEMYKTYCDDAKIGYPFSKRVFKEELKNYFREYKERFVLEDGSRVRSYYIGFRTDRFEESSDEKEPKEEKTEDIWLRFESIPSLFDVYLKDCPAQYASKKETPTKKWDEVTTTLTNIDTSKLHYVKTPASIITVDFDIPDENGNKCLEKNMEAANKWPKTYAELSKSGCGIHLEYLYSGDASKLSRIYDDHIEIKVAVGDSSLRRMLTKCNDVPIATISSGLPLKGEKMVSQDIIVTEKGIRTLIKRNLNKEIHPGTKPSIDFIHKILEDAYKNGTHYDVTDMRNAVYAFAAGSTHQAEYCINLVSNMKFRSDEQSSPVDSARDTIIFYDVEVFPNLFLVNWKLRGQGKTVVRMINPTSKEIESLLQYKLVGFNCRRYDNHILYARLMGYSNEKLFELSQKIIDGSPNSMFGEAYNLSYTDVYDFCSKKQSLKKWEIELGIHHKELGLPWDKPVPEELWPKVAEYCDNDVIATEAVFDARQGDFIARQIQVELVKSLHGISNVTVNDTTNSLSTKIIFGKNKNPQNQFNYRDLSMPVSWTEYGKYRELFGKDYVFHIFDENGLPTYDIYDDDDSKLTALPTGWSILPFFPKYRFEVFKSYWIHDVSNIRKPISELQETDYDIIGEGGRVYSSPGMYGGVWDGDIASQHPHSIIAEQLFGPIHTKIFEDIVKARVAIKHKDFDAAGSLLNDVLKPFLNEEQADALAQALKIVINSIYGLTSASFDNPFRDKRNKDNIVAKRGALFMTLLKEEVEKQGFKVCHIKTDSIKIPDANEAIKDFVIRFGREYGYEFETEANFEKYCLVNDAVYVAKYLDGKKAGSWMSVGAQFQIPYVFKTLFSKEDITFEDMCETKSVSSALYLDMNEDLPPEEHDYHFIGKVGQFCPIRSGCGGGELLREAKDADGNVKYASATGAKGYRWLESEMVKTLEKEKDIDRSYYDRLVDEAVSTISEYGDFEWFTSDDPYISPWFAAENPDEVPWLETEDELFVKR